MSKVLKLKLTFSKNWLEFRLAKGLLLTTLFLIYIPTIFSQEIEYAVSLSDQDILETISGFKAKSPFEMVKFFQKNMPNPQIEGNYRNEIIKDLPPKYHELRIKDKKLDDLLNKVIEPVLSLYQRKNVYEIFIIKHPKPLIFSDSGVVLGLTTGILMEIENDDEILGYIAHEVAHDYFLKYSIYARYLINQTDPIKKDSALNKKLIEILSIIEIQCDLFSALTMKTLNYSPTAFIDSILRFEKKFSQNLIGYHPTSSLRRKIADSVVGVQIQQNNKISQDLEALKKYQIKLCELTKEIIEVTSCVLVF